MTEVTFAEMKYAVVGWLNTAPAGFDKRAVQALLAVEGFSIAFRVERAYLYLLNKQLIDEDD
jgi:hypothetical protein